MNSVVEFQETASLSSRGHTVWSSVPSNNDTPFFQCGVRRKEIRMNGIGPRRYDSPRKSYNPYLYMSRQSAILSSGYRLAGRRPMITVSPQDKPVFSAASEKVYRSRAQKIAGTSTTIPTLFPLEMVSDSTPWKASNQTSNNRPGRENHVASM